MKKAVLILTWLIAILYGLSIPIEILYGPSSGLGRIFFYIIWGPTFYLDSPIITALFDLLVLSIPIVSLIIYKRKHIFVSVIALLVALASAGLHSFFIFGFTGV